LGLRARNSCLGSDHELVADEDEGRRTGGCLPETV